MIAVICLVRGSLSGTINTEAQATTPVPNEEQSRNTLVKLFCFSGTLKMSFDFYWTYNS
jgi:hypothetical protein